MKSCSHMMSMRVSSARAEPFRQKGVGGDDATCVSVQGYLTYKKTHPPRTLK